MGDTHHEAHMMAQAEIDAETEALRHELVGHIGWKRQSGTLVSENTSLGFYTITGSRRIGFRAWLHRSEMGKDSLVVADGPDEESVQLDVALYDKRATPNTVHRTAKRFVS